ncbi:hypothetical protein D018_4000B, partial [Vibrio parahaemolyticus VP2007-007]
KTKALQLAAY